MQYQVMPALTPIEYEALKADIAERGVLVPVELDEAGAVLDGHHRVRACEELGIASYPTITRAGLSEEQKRNHARSLNVLRRHLSREQRDEVMRAMRADGATYQQIANAVGVSVFTAHKAASEVPILEIKNGAGQTRPATYQRQPDPQPLPAWVTAPIEDEAQEAQPAEPDPEPLTAADLAVMQPTPTRTERPPREPEPTALKPAMAVHFSSETPEHYTPDLIIAAALACFGEIDLDPCSNSKDAPNIPAAAHYTRHDDGLAQEWAGRVYMNPPYGREIDAWIAKLIEEYQSGNVTEAIALVPARTDTQWWQRLRDYHVCFVEGRLSFKGAGYNESAPFPSAVFYLGSNTDRFVDAFEEIGDIWHRTRRGYCFGE